MSGPDRRKGAAIRAHTGRISVLSLLLALAACAPSDPADDPSASAEPSVAPVATASPSEQVDTFPNEAFDDIGAMAGPLVDAVRSG